MLDLIISGGTIIDGSGGAPFTADVGIAGGTIVALGRFDEPARETIKADGALVTPGFIDLHSHFDGQFTWDDKLEPFFSQGLPTMLGGKLQHRLRPRHCRTSSLAHRQNERWRL